MAGVRGHAACAGLASGSAPHPSDAQRPPPHLTSAARPPKNAAVSESSSSVLRVAVVGFGYWGPNLVRNFTTCPQTRVVAVVDPDPGRRKLVGVQYPWVATHAELTPVLADPDVDAV